MTARPFQRHGLTLSLHDGGGGGIPVVMQHGLCGAQGQIAEFLPASRAVRPITLECRGHGGSEAGDPAAFSIATFADDVVAAIEALTLCPVVVGGVSMGAAIASRVAVRRPDLVRALVLIRPAWVAAAAPANMRPNAEVGRLLQAYPPDEARARFAVSPIAAALRADAPDNLASLESFFSRAPLAVTAALLTAISEDGPGVTEYDLASMRVPTLVVGHERDAIHPVAHAMRLAALIPTARLVEITPKATDKARYLADLSAATAAFLSDLTQETAP